MTTATDMDTMAGVGDDYVDEFLGGHTDADLTALFTTSNIKEKIDGNSAEMTRFLFGLVGELINKVYDLENP